MMATTPPYKEIDKALGQGNLAHAETLIFNYLDVHGNDATLYQRLADIAVQLELPPDLLLDLPLEYFLLY